MITKRRRVAFLSSLATDYSVAVWHGVKRAATQRGVEVVVYSGMCVGSPDPSELARNRVYDLVNPAQVDGAIVLSSLIGHYCGVSGIKQLCDSLAPLPVCSIGHEIPGVPSLTVSNEIGVFNEISHLIQVHDRRRIAYIAAQRNSPESNARLAGYREALLAHGIAADERLILHADFMAEGGRAAMMDLLASGVDFDAVVAANDYMALGALEALQAAHRSIPFDVALAGFDDSGDAACTRPSLTSLRQPMTWLGSAAVDCILQQLDGERVPLCQTKGVDLVRRESCGCGYRGSTSMQPTASSCDRVSELIRRERPRLSRLLMDTVLDSVGALGAWPSELLDALEAELSGEEGRFAVGLEALLNRALDERLNLEEFQHSITALRSELRRHLARDHAEVAKLEHLWHSARVTIASGSLRLVGRQRSQLGYMNALLGRSGERLTTTLSFPLLKDELAVVLPMLNVDLACVSLFVRDRPDTLSPLLVLRSGVEVGEPEREFDSRQLAPTSFMQSEQATHYVVMPLTYGSDVMGLAVMSGEAFPLAYETLRQQIGSAIRSIQLHREMMNHVANREKYDKMRVAAEAMITGELQTAIIPRSLLVPGLEIAHVMMPSSEAGGDYYDVLPDAGGAWLAMGDVSGHGLGSGLIMLMLQSMVSSLVRVDRAAAPSRILTVLNEALYENVRQRLSRDDHATLTLLRYERSGLVRFCGLHEPIIVYRAAEQRSECIIPPGFWVGAFSEVQGMMSDDTLTLHDGDLLVLYTDGITEPRNAQHEQFSVERLRALIEARATRPVSEIRDDIVAAVRAWSSDMDDDMSILIARYHGTGADVSDESPPMVRRDA